MDAPDYGEPSSYLTLAKGTDVVSSDGETIGKVEHVLAEEESDIFDGVIIDTQTGPGGHRFVDADQVDECFERAVQLKVSAAEAESLPEPAPNPAAMEHHGTEDVEKALEHKLHRAWEFLSGKRPE